MEKEEIGGWLVRANIMEEFSSIEDEIKIRNNLECPDCKVEMYVIERGETEIKYRCPSCNQTFTWSWNNFMSKFNDRGLVSV